MDSDTEDNFSLSQLYWEKYVGAEEKYRIIANMSAVLSSVAERVVRNLLNNNIYTVSKKFIAKLKAAFKL